METSGKAAGSHAQGHRTDPHKQARVRNISVCGNDTVTHLNSSVVKLPFCGSGLEACSSKGETMFRRCYRSYVTKYGLDLLHCTCTGWNYKFNKTFFLPFPFFERVSLCSSVAWKWLWYWGWPRVSDSPASVSDGGKRECTTLVLRGSGDSTGPHVS